MDLLLVKTLEYRCHIVTHSQFQPSFHHKWALSLALNSSPFLFSFLSLKVVQKELVSALWENEALKSWLGPGNMRIHTPSSDPVALTMAVMVTMSPGTQESTRSAVSSHSIVRGILPASRCPSPAISCTLREN